MTQGDPVDVITGRVFTLPAVDVRLPGPLPLVIERSYSSAARDRDVGLGLGTTHSLAWEIEERRRTMVVWTGEGTSVELPCIKEGDALGGPEGWLLHRIGEDIALDFANGIRYLFVRVAGGGTPRRLRLGCIASPQGATITLRYEGHMLRMILDSAGREIRVRTGAAPASGGWRRGAGRARAAPHGRAARGSPRAIGQAIALRGNPLAVVARSR